MRVVPVLSEDSSLPLGPRPIDEDVVKIDEQEPVVLEDPINEALEGLSCIAEAKWHANEFK